MWQGAAARGGQKRFWWLRAARIGMGRTPLVSDAGVGRDVPPSRSELGSGRGGDTPALHSRKSLLCKRTTQPHLPEHRVCCCLRFPGLALEFHCPPHLPPASVLGRFAPCLVRRPDT